MTKHIYENTLTLIIEDDKDNVWMCTGCDREYETAYDAIQCDCDE